jgi:hypothetical protein
MSPDIAYFDPQSIHFQFVSRPNPHYAENMFTIEHDFDATVVTLIDDGSAPLQDDISISAFASVIIVEQYDPQTCKTNKISLSMAQLRDLRAALNLPEGSYKFTDTT